MKTDLSHIDPAVRAMLAEDLPSQLAHVRSAIEKGDVDSAINTVHVVKGSAAYCKLEGLRHQSDQLETCLKNNEKDAALQQAFENEISKVIHALEREQESDQR